MFRHCKLYSRSMLHLQLFFASSCCAELVEYPGIDEAVAAKRR